MERLNMTSHKEKFQQLLRELFQFDCADLDFGIYRIMNYKRDAIEKFIIQDLPRAIADELDRDTLADQAQAAKELKGIAEQITQTLGKDALDADGNLAATYHGTPLGKKYLDLKTKAAGGHGREALEASIFNHLLTFFSRCYQDGDFISKRRYSKRQRYAIPYNGEEVYLYWANNDQYYVKTAEHFHDYTFTARGVTTHFKLQAASVEQNNVKGDKRLFLPRVKETEWKEGAGELILPFEYRPLTDQEEITYGKKNQQDAIIAQAVEEIPQRLKKADKALVALTAEHYENSDGQPVTFLEHHLRQYTRQNTSDFFIHKDLKGFLSRELDFYLKNEVLNLDEMESAGEDRAEGWFQIMRVIKTVGGRIIEFLDQIECFQKMLWEKRKFITETQYCITVGNIDKIFYPDIVLCEPQWAEWKELFHIDEEQTDLFSTGKSKKDKRITFLKVHPTLVLDTKHFDQDFFDRLLGSFEDLDDMTDGLLVHSENFQALSLMLEKYRRCVHCIHIDPPYNTHTSGFLYKNDYQHSSWLAMMENRIGVSLALLSLSGSYLCHIDENEYERLQLLFERFSILNAGTIAWDKRNPMNAGRGVATQHEYVIWRSGTETPIYMRNDNIISMLKAAAEIIKKY
jgi:adenine-specific DNA-methyltransferase